MRINTVKSEDIDFDNIDLTKWNLNEGRKLYKVIYSGCSVMTWDYIFIRMLLGTNNELMIDEGYSETLEKENKAINLLLKKYNQKYFKKEFGLNNND